jgi:REP element-mobilizing transposase RayT
LRAFGELRQAFAAGRERFGFRLTEFSVQSNHLHLMVEAEDTRALSRGMQGLAIRCARTLNRLWQRRGAVFSDRYHAHVLRTPTEVRRALRYVLENARRHGVALVGPDPCSSAARGLRGPVAVVAARSWLQRLGWRRKWREGGVGRSRADP